MPIRVTVWNEFRHEKKNPKVTEIYPKGMHEVIAGFLGRNSDIIVRTATLDEPEHGLTDETLSSTDVLIWWGHMAHDEVRDDIVQKVYGRVMDGMGFIALHSAHASKIFQKLCGTRSDMLSWRENEELERLFSVNPGHPILAGLPEYFEIPHTETYGEYFNIPQPDELLLISWFEGGEVFRSAFTLTRGKGRVVYFRPGHETFPIFRQAEVQTFITNAVRWAAPPAGMADITYRGGIPLPRP